MQEFLANKNNLVVILVVLVVLAVISLFVTSMRKRSNEGFATPAVTVAPVQAPVPVAAVAAPVPVAAQAPVPVNVTVGTLVNGPGFEKGPEPITAGVFANVPDNFFLLDDGANGEMSVQNNLCSKSCCSPSWPVPFKERSDPFVCNGLKNGLYTPSNLFCSNSFQDAGCACLTKEQGRFINQRGNGGSPWY